MVANFSSFYLLPGVCIGCNTLTQRERDLCINCEQAMTHNTVCCAHCALPLAQSASSCGRCQTEATHYSQALSAFRYESNVAEYIQAFKFHRKLPYGRVLSEILADRIRERYVHAPLPELLLPVPQHWQHAISRGYNQAHEIALCLRAELLIPINYKALKRQQRGLKQSSLNRKQRLTALKNCFSVHRPAQLDGKHVAVIDDVMTTGATASTLAALLKQAGCNKVDIWSLARTPLK